MAYFRAGTARATHEAQQITVAKTPLATFQSNVSGLYLPEILAYIQATQSGSGDPSPSNPRAISGVSEVTTACNAVNQWDEQWELGSFDSTGNPISSTTSIRSKNFIPVKPSTSYYFLFNTSNSAKLYVIQYNARKEYISYLPNTYGITSPRAFTTASDCSFIKLDFASAYGTTYLNDCSINYPATDTTYHAYTGQTATTALGGTYYGGYLNVPTGLLTVTHSIVDLGDVSWRFNADMGVFYTSDIKGNKTPDEFICSEYATNMTNVSLSNLPDLSGVLRTAALYIRDNSYQGSTTSFTTGVTGVKLVHPLATPQTYQLTPAQLEQLLGQNNVFCSSGDVAVKYWKID